MVHRFVTDIERLKRLEPVMERCGVEASGFINTKTNSVIAPIVKKYFRDQDGFKHKGHAIYFDDPTKDIEESWIINPSCDKNLLPLFDYAALESVLPDWAFGDDLVEDILEITFIALRFDRNITTDEDFKLASKVKRLLEKIMCSRFTRMLRQNSCPLSTRS